MFRSLGCRLALCLLPVTFLSTTHLQAVERAAELLPSTTVVYVELAKPAQTIEAVLKHPVAGKVRGHAFYQEATKSPKYKQFQTVLKFAEAQLGMNWLEAVGKLTDGGVSLAYDAETQGIAVLLKSESAEALEQLTSKAMQFAKQDAENKGKSAPFEQHEYRAVPVYKADKALFTMYENWLVIVNKPDLGRRLLDGLLDGPKNSLAGLSSFQTASGTSGNKIAWAYANLEMIRESGKAQKVFSGKADDPGAELIFGGVLDILPHASYVTASLQGLPDNLEFSISLPFQADWISEQREHYFGPEAKGSVTAVRSAGQSIASLSVYRNVSEMWLRTGDLFNENINEKFAKADSTLTTLFSGKDFGEDILAAVSPEMQIVVTRQEFAADRPVPEIKLPAFALVTHLKDPEATTSEFQRIFLSFIGFLNVTGGAEGRPQLDLNMETLDSGRIVSTRFVPLAGREPAEQTSIAYNFSPTMAFQNNLFVLASTSELARKLLTGEETPLAVQSEYGKDSRINLALDVNATGIRQALEDNREHLIAQNILKKGQSREEAEGEIGVLFELLKLIDSAHVRVLTTDETFETQLKLQFAE